MDEVPEDSRGYLCSAVDAGRQASQAGVGRLMLTHLQPGTDRSAARAAAAEEYHGPIDVADGGPTIDLH